MLLTSSTALGSLAIGAPAVPEGHDELMNSARVPCSNHDDSAAQDFIGSDGSCYPRYDRRAIADWTLIATSIGTATVTGLSTYLVTRRQTAVTIEQIERQASVAMEGIRAENERLRQQHREDHLRNRQGTYHAFMNADVAVANSLASGQGDIASVGRLSDLANGVLLFGSEEAALAVGKIVEFYGGIAEEVSELGLLPDDQDAFNAELAARVNAQRATLGKLRKAAVDAMRADVLGTD